MDSPWFHKGRPALQDLSCATLHPAPAGKIQRTGAQTHARDASPLPQLPSPGLDFPICNMADSDTVSHSGREVGGEGPPHQ